jgi:murein DD-endopeptidase MepM/ murein hydrolase activator NlpD
MSRRGLLLVLVLCAVVSSDPERARRAVDDVLSALTGEAHPDPPAPDLPTCTSPVATSFAWPVGPPDGAGYYDAQPFGTNQHLGADLNGRGGGDSDLGDPVYAIADGCVVVAQLFGGGWGKVVRVVHPTADGGAVESLYAHLQSYVVEVGQRVTRGQAIGAIGTAEGLYRAHLHLEIRRAPNRPLGPGYGVPDAQVDPVAFLRTHGS